MLNQAATIQLCRLAAKEAGMTFKKDDKLTINGRASYMYVMRNTGEVVRYNLTLSLAFEIACSGELSQVD